MTAAQILAQLALPVSLLTACCWVFYALLRTMQDRTRLGMAACGIRHAAREIDRVSRWRHLWLRLTLQDWRRLYPAALIHVAQRQGRA